MKKSRGSRLSANNNFSLFSYSKLILINLLTKTVLIMLFIIGLKQNTHKTKDPKSS